jgi:hypothetical protein
VAILSPLSAKFASKIESLGEPLSHPGAALGRLEGNPATPCLARATRPPLRPAPLHKKTGMTFLRKITVGLASIGLLVLLPWLPAVGQDEKKQDEKKPLPLPKEINWKLSALNQEPLKVISTEYIPNFAPKTAAVAWVIELTRDLDVYEQYAYWGPAYKESKRPLFRFEFQDSTGIVLRVVDCQYVGEFVTKAGKRFGAVLVSPSDLPRTTTIEAVPR